MPFLRRSDGHGLAGDVRGGHLCDGVADVEMLPVVLEATLAVGVLQMISKFGQAKVSRNDLPFSRLSSPGGSTSEPGCRD